MVLKKIKSNTSPQRFRCNVSIDTLLHITTVMAAIIITWSNLQKELALIRYDLNQLINTNTELRQQIKKITEQNNNYEYRLNSTENQLQYLSTLVNDTQNNKSM